MRTNNATNIKMICKYSTLLFICVLLFGCDRDAKFDKAKWLQQDDMQHYPYRLSMLKNLTGNYKLIGLTYFQLIELIGEPQKNLVTDSMQIYYPILTDYGSDIDPVHTISLEIVLNKDSIVNDYQIDEWKKQKED